MTVAALFVQTNGCYFGVDDVDPWDERRDARLYAGPHPVVAHPPCGTWGAFARSGLTRRPLGDDDGCFEAALAAVRRWCGVLEHPAQSSAWTTFHLRRPWRPGWVSCAPAPGFVCAVDQGHFGHRARKPTWLYAVGVDLPHLPQVPAIGLTPYKQQRGNWHTERAATPPAFRDVLLDMARSATR